MDSNGTDYYMRSWLANQPISKHIWPLPKSNRHGAQKNARPAYHQRAFSIYSRVPRLWAESEFRPRKKP